MKKKQIIFLSLALLIIPSVVWGLGVSFSNPIDPTGTGTITDLFESILEGILNIIAALGILFIVISGVIYLIASASGNEAMTGTAKKIATGSLVGLILGLSGPTLMGEIMDIILGVGGVMPDDLDTAPSLSEIVARALSFLLSIIATIAIISLTVNGILYLVAGGDSSKAEKVKNNIKFSIIGFVISGSALILVRQIIWFIEN
jgi:hypothetical protein